VHALIRPETLENLRRFRELTEARAAGKRSLDPKANAQKTRELWQFVALGLLIALCVYLATRPENVSPDIDAIEARDFNR